MKIVLFKKPDGGQVRIEIFIAGDREYWSFYGESRTFLIPRESTTPTTPEERVALVQDYTIIGEIQ